MPEKPYRRVPGRGRRMAGIGPINLTRTQCRLYLGEDHLLCIDSSGFTEDYRRFSYRDIQAVVVRKTGRGRSWSIGLAAAAAVGGLIGFALGGVGAYVLWSIAALLLILLVGNVARGPTCVCHLRTAVHAEELASLNRLRTARKALVMLQPFIRQAQGEVTSEEIATYLSQPQEAASSASAAQRGPGRAGFGSALAQVPSGYRGRFHWLLFSLLLLDGIQGIIALYVRHVMVAFTSSLLMGALGVATILAVVQQQRSSLSPGVQRVTWSTLVYTCVNFVIAYVLFVVLATRQTGVGNDQWQYLQMFAELSPWETPWLLGLFLYSIITSFALGVLGMLSLGHQRRMERRAQAAARLASAPASESNVSPSE